MPPDGTVVFVVVVVVVVAVFVSDDVPGVFAERIAMATMGLLRFTPPVEPEKAASRS